MAEENADLFEAAREEEQSDDAGAMEHLPLATRMRPRSMDEFVGQTHLLDEDKALGKLLRKGVVPNMVLWGPPGTGKTTLSHVISNTANATLEPFSAVSEGVKRLRELAEQARGRRHITGRGTIVFVDEIHRLNKGQQDTLLPLVEEGVFTLIGATTENPSFSLNGALQSRVRIFILKPLEASDLVPLLKRAVEDSERGLGKLDFELEEGVLEIIGELAAGDARRALGTLEMSTQLLSKGETLTKEAVKEASGDYFVAYDRSGDLHYDFASALQKSIRGSDVHASLYWTARMLEGGEDPRFVLRRIIITAAEDISLADPQALVIATSALQAYEFVGPPEGYIPIAQAVIYLATAPKSNRGYKALQAARDLAGRTPTAPVPDHLRKAPTQLMKDMGLGEGYEYPFDREEHFSPIDYLPRELGRVRLYEPSTYGFEKKIGERMSWWGELKKKLRGLRS